MASGFLFIDKPDGITSHDVVNIARKRLGIKKIGHSGTLDPFASGLLILGVEKATRLLEYIKDFEKTYNVRMKLGVVTDTFDITGKVAEEHSTWKDLTEIEIVDTLKSFEGEYLQVPPAYSAKRYKGKRLYQLAREGKIINLPPKKVKIFSISNIEVNHDNGEVAFKAKVSSGTYIRSLVMDVGYQLGCGATTTYLRREKIGNFSVHEAIAPEEISSFSIVEPERVLSGFLPSIIVTEAQGKAVLNGQQIWLNGLAGIDGKFKKDDLVRVIDEEGIFLAIARAERDSSFIRKLFEKMENQRIAKLIKVFGD
ncbi:tRNA pseudouridine synthase B [Kosmotoga arenicorallina S304]|uniref:tRNA pseudouridine synthase B n=1 Tax=Kosmotoga arenicorallina S304 TaxID=1453497 RepID=A0A176K0F9_9BACT|nr:tRNA pseudouridine(55) synthase TruB [Kosmotoga arenicorallina]OAA29734.1 tRNA pseudouridine synthase B [Kosmotoga arenicorallina S304]